MSEGKNAGSGLTECPQEAAVVHAITAAFPLAEVVEQSGWRGGYWESRQRRAQTRGAARAAKDREATRGWREALGLAPKRDRAPEATVAPGAASAAPSLEELTLDHQRQVRTGWACTFFEYPGGAMELRAYYVGPHDARPRGARGATFDDRPEVAVAPVGMDVYIHGDERSRVELERFDSSTARSRAACMRRCLALQADHMLTLTKRGKFESIDEAWACFEKFSQSMRRKFGARWKFVAVPEAHKEGGYHMPLARCRGNPAPRWSRKCERSYKGRSSTSVLQAAFCGLRGP